MTRKKDATYQYYSDSLGHDGQWMPAKLVRAGDILLNIFGQDMPITAVAVPSNGRITITYSVNGGEESVNPPLEHMLGIRRTG